MRQETTVPMVYPKLLVFLSNSSKGRQKCQGMHPNHHRQPCFPPAGVVCGSEQRKVEDDELSHGKEWGRFTRLSSQNGDPTRSMVSGDTCQESCRHGMQPAREREKRAAVNEAGGR